MNEKISENTYTLHNQVEIPCVGFGTWQVPDGETAANAVMHAIEAGYTLSLIHIFKAEFPAGGAN